MTEKKDEDAFLNELLDSLPVIEVAPRQWRNLLLEEDAVELLWQTRVTVFKDRFVRAGMTGTRVPLAFVLLEEFEAWAHHAQYTSRNSCRLTKHPDSLGEREPEEIKAACDLKGLYFTCVIIDLDHANKGTGEPVPKSAYRDLLKKAVAAEYVPNVIHETNGGAHLVYLLSSPIVDPMLFEAVHTKMRELTKTWASDYKVDDQASDWTRLLACAKVVKDDDSTTYDRHICALHMDPLAWKGLGVTVKKKRSGGYTGPGVLKFTGRDGKIRQFLDHEPPQGERYCTLRDVAYYVHSKYHPSSWAELRELLEERAEQIGLPASRYDSALKILNGDH